MNSETHTIDNIWSEITSFELVRLVEAVGSDTIGIVFDTHNVLQRVEHPVWAARRLAPYVRQTHIKDGIAVPARRVWTIGFRASHSFATYLRWQLLQVLELVDVIPGGGQTMAEHIVSFRETDLAVVFG